MDLEFTPEELKFRDEVRAWIAENYTDDPKGAHGAFQERIA
ncbi:MAG: hypothetical protein R3C46_00865 [Hyphomonadaceae bacterium]